MPLRDRWCCRIRRTSAREPALPTVPSTARPVPPPCREPDLAWASTRSSHVMRILLRSTSMTICFPVLRAAPSKWRQMVIEPYVHDTARAPRRPRRGMGLHSFLSEHIQPSKSRIGPTMSLATPPYSRRVFSDEWLGARSVPYNKAMEPFTVSDTFSIFSAVHRHRARLRAFASESVGWGTRWVSALFGGLDMIALPT